MVGSVQRSMGQFAANAAVGLYWLALFVNDSIASRVGLAAAV